MGLYTVYTSPPSLKEVSGGLVTGIEKALQKQAIAVLSTFYIYWLVIKFQNFMIINRVHFSKKLVGVLMHQWLAISVI